MANKISYDDYKKFCKLLEEKGKYIEVKCKLSVDKNALILRIGNFGEALEKGLDVVDYYLFEIDMQEN